MSATVRRGIGEKPHAEKGQDWAGEAERALGSRTTRAWEAYVICFDSV